MNIVDLLTMVIAVAVVLAVVFGAFIFAAFRFRRGPRPIPDEGGNDGRRYFVRYRPEGRTDEG
jgi:hypothetical protein